MLFNKDNPQWYFSEARELSSEERSEITDKYNELTRKMLTTDFRDIDEQFYGIKPSGDLTEEETASKRKKMLIGAVAGIIIFAGLIIALIFKQLLIFGYAACAIFLVVGISVMVTGKGDRIESTSRAGLNRIIGLFMALASLMIILLIIFRGRFSSGEFFILLFVIVFGLSGLGLLIVTVIKAFSGKLIYKDEITATCAGYVRYVSRDQSSNGYNRVHTFIHTSPLFKYSYEGTQYEAVYDEFPVKADSDIEPGQTVTIKIDPRHPENIKSPVTTHPVAIGFSIFMGLAFIGVAVGLGIYTAGGYAAGTKVDTKWNPLVEKINGNNPDLVDITDDYMTENYIDKQFPGKEWYYERGVVTGKEQVEGGTAIELSDDSFMRILYTDNTAPEPGTELLIFYVINEENLQYGIRYKNSVSTADPNKFEYVGTHGAYVMTPAEPTK
ncbi:MAG: hypothetical protein IKH76_06565 [Clostridiales bacterium]|nr:hypothetical protein [Clostridiales bacterium]